MGAWPVSHGPGRSLLRGGSDLFSASLWSFGGLPWGESRECGLRCGRQELRLYLERAVYFRAEPLPRGLKRHDALTFRRALAKIQRRQA